MRRDAFWNVGAVCGLLSKAADRNPYSWNMEFYEHPDGSGYEGRFTKCGSIPLPPVDPTVTVDTKRKEIRRSARCLSSR